MNKNKQKLICNILVGILTVICVITSVYFGFRRNIYHIDEVWSYSLGNSTEGKYWFDWWYNGDIAQDPAPAPEEFFDHWHDGSFFKKYITVQKGEEFRYDIAYHYQATDVSPPLYYAMLHTICSFFPEQFSRWFGLIPNLIFYALCIPLLYHIAVQLFKNRQQALAATAFWALSRAAFSDANMIRMYMLATVFCLVSFALHLKMLKEWEKIPLVPLIAMYLINVMGFLTQNYVYVYTFFMAAGICIILLIRRKIKQMFVFGITELISVGTAFLIFPAAVKQMTKSNYGKTSLSNIIVGNSLSERGFIKVIIHNIFGINDDVFILDLIQNVLNSITVFLLLFVGLFYLLIMYLIPKNKINIDGKSKEQVEKIRNVLIQKIHPKLKALFEDTDALKIALLFFATILTGRIIEQASPDMGIFQDRYYFMILPLSFLGVAWIVFKIIGACARKKEKIMLIAEAVLVAIAIAGNLVGENNYFLFYAKGQRELQSMMAGQTCFILTSYQYPIYLSHNDAVWLQDAEKAYFTKQADQQLIDNISECQNCYLLVNEGYPKSILNQFSGQRQVEDIGLYSMSEGSFEIYYLS